MPAIEARRLVTSEEFPRCLRLTRGSDINSTMRCGSRFDTPHLAISWVHNEEGKPRFAFVVARRGGTAVARNRLRRWLREITRRFGGGVIGSRDVVIRTKPSAGRADYNSLKAELQEWFGSLQA